LQTLLQQQQPAQQAQQQPTPQQAEDASEDSIRASQRTIAAGAAELDFSQDKKIQAAVDFAPFTPEIAKAYGVVPGIRNPDGTFSSERTISVEVQELNSGKPTLIPTIVRGKQVSNQEAIGFAVQSGLEFPGFDSNAEADAFAKRRSDSGALLAHGPLGRSPDALGRFNKIREKYGLGPADKLPEKVGIVEQAKELSEEDIPLGGGFFTVAKLWNVQAAAKRIEDDKGTAEDWETLAAHMEQSVMDARERTFGGGVARITLGSVPFWADFFASGGLPAILKKGGKEVAKKAIKKSLSGVLKKAALDVGRLAGTTLLRLPVFSHRVTAEAFQRATPEFAAYIPDGAEDFEFVVLDEGEGGMEATLNAIGSVYIEIFSEQTHKVVGLIGGKARRAVGMKPARVGARAFLDKFGIGSVTGEMAEERLNEGLRKVASLIPGVDLPAEAPTLEQLAQEAVAFTIPIAGVRTAARFKRDRPTMERARGFVELHPEASQRIAGLEGKVSRKQLKDAAGDAISGEQVSQMRRDVFRDMIGAAVEERAQPTSEEQLEQTLMQHQVQAPRDEAVTEPVARQAQEVRLQQPAPTPGEEAAETAEPAVELPREALPVDEIPKFRRKGANPVTAFLRRLFTPAGVLPEGAFERARESNQWYRARLKEIENLDRDFMAGAKEAYGGVGKMSDEDVLAVNAALGGKPIVSFLPEPLQEPVRAMRQKIDELSTQLINDGVVEGGLAAIIEKNKGLWLHRQYRAFIDPKWSKNVPVTIRNDFKSWLRQEYLADGMELTDNQLEQQMNELLFKAKEAGTPIGFFSKLGKKDQSIFIKRKDLPEIYRAFLGEVKDPRFNFVSSAQKQAHVIAAHKFLTQVRQEGLGRFLFEAEDPNIPPEAVAEIAAKNGEAMWPLNGLKTYPEVAKAFEQATKSDTVGNFHRMYLKAIGGAKLTKTVLSETTQVRNVLSWNQMFLNTGLLWHFGPRGFMRAARTIVDDFRRTPNKERRAAVVRGIELGVLHDGAVSGEMKHALEGAVKGDEAAFADSLYDNARPWHRRAAAKALRGGTKGTAKTIEAATKLYRAGDDLPRYIMWKMMQARLRKALPDATDIELEEMAARELRDTAPTYSMVPELWRAIGRNAPVAPFTSFPYEIFRTYGNNLKRIGTEFQDPKMRGIAAERLVGTLLVPITIPAISAVSRMLVSGMDREQENAMREFLPDYAVDGEFYHLPVPDKPHAFRVIDMSYVDPYVYMRSPIMRFLRNQDEGILPAMMVAAKKFLDPFTSEELLVQRILDVSRNKTEYGGTVYNEQADWDSQVRDVFVHLLGAYEPGTIAQVRRAYRGMRGVIEPWGQVRDPVDEMMAATGQRPMQINIPTALGRQARNFSGNWSEATNILTTHARSKGDVSLDLLRQKHEEMVESKRRLFAGLQREIPAATKLGMIEKEIRKVFDDAGLSGQTIDSLFRNEFDEESFIKAEVLRLTDRKPDETSVRFFKAMGMSQREVFDVLREAWRARGYKLLDIKSGRLNRSLSDRQRRLHDRYPGGEGP
jgi:hypothetical protein